MSRKPIFTQEGKPQTPGQSQASINKPPETRASQLLKKSELINPTHKPEIQNVQQSMVRDFSSAGYVTSREHHEVLQMNIHEVIKEKNKFIRSGPVDELALSRMVKDILDKEGFSLYNSQQKDDLVRRDINILAQHIREMQKSIEMLRAVYLEQRNQTQQSVAPGVQDKLFKQIQAFEESFASKINSAQEQLVQHQELFQQNYGQRFQDLRNLFDNLKTQTTVNENKLNKCIQFIAKIDVQEDQVNQTNNKIQQMEQNFNQQIAQLKNSYQILVNQTTKKLADQFEHQINEINTILSTRAPRAEGSSVSDVALQELNLEIANLKKRLQDQTDKQLGAMVFLNEVNTNLEKLRYDFSSQKDEFHQYKRDIKEQLSKIQRANDEFRQVILADQDLQQNKMKSLNMSMQSNLQSFNLAMDLRLKAIEQQQQGKKNEILFSFSQKLGEDHGSHESKYESKEYEYNKDSTTTHNRSPNPGSYTIQSERLEIDSDGELTKGDKHSKHISFQSVEVETFEYTENKFIEEEDDGEVDARVKTESDVVEIGTTKGENKESFQERISEMRRLPDISERLEEYDSLELPTQKISLTGDPFIPQQNKMMTESEMRSTPVKQTEVSQQEEEEEEVTYQLDENGYLMDEEGSYILDGDGKMIQLDSTQIAYLREQQLVEE